MGHKGLDQLLGLSDVQPALGNFRYSPHPQKRGEGKNGPGVPCGKLSVLHQLLDGNIQIQQPQGVGHRAPGLAHPFRRLSLGHAVDLRQRPEAFRLLDGVQVLPLEVLDHGQLHGLLVVGLDDDRRDLVQSGHPGGPPAAFPGDDLIVPASQLTHRQGLDHAVLPDGLGQLLQLFLVEVFPGLVLIALDLRDGQGGGRRGKIGGKILTQQGAQSLTHSFFFCHRVVPPSAYFRFFLKNSSASAA